MVIQFESMKPLTIVPSALQEFIPNRWVSHLRSLF
jgi:hypothetical protein